MTLTYEHTGHELDDLDIGSSRPRGAKRTLFYGNCKCGWQGQSRSTRKRVVQDWREHMTTIHRRTTVHELGFERAVCAECETTWPCREEVMRRCQVNYLDHGIPCDCGWHDDA